jgi:hypothetical protein
MKCPNKQRHRFTPRRFRDKEFTLPKCIYCDAKNPNYLPKTLDEVFAEFETNREQFGQLIRRGLIPRVQPGDYELTTKIYKRITKCGLNKEYSDFHKEVKKDFMNCPMSWV